MGCRFGVGGYVVLLLRHPLRGRSQEGLCVDGVG